MTQTVMAHMLGVTERTAIAAEAGKALTDGVRRRVTELRRLQGQLGAVVPRSAVGRWLTEPNATFDD